MSKAEELKALAKEAIDLEAKYIVTHNRLDRLLAEERKKELFTAIDAQQSIIDEQRTEIERLTKDVELLALVLASPETAAEELEDAAAGDGTPRENLERRLAGSPAELEGDDQ